MNKSDHAAGARVHAQVDVVERHSRPALRVPPDLEPVGKCPYCHHDLMKRDIRIPMIMLKLVRSFTRDWDVLMTYWVCMNEECCLMFWRHPHSVSWGPPTPDDTLEH